jgi:hypothetical protein
MAKYYVMYSKDHPQDAAKRSFWFDNSAENAFLFKTREEADKRCLDFDRAAIEVPLLHGGKYTCGGFRTEELSPTRFVAYCEVPGAIKAA